MLLIIGQQKDYKVPEIEPQLQSHFSATQTQGERVNDANVEDNGVPASTPHNPRMLQGLWRPDPTVTQEHGNSSNAVERPHSHDRSSKRPSRRRPKAPAVGELQWEQKKPYIEQLYMKEDLPLSEVIKRMGETHGFHATFKAWRWSKNAPIAWMKEKAREREVDGKDTVFYWNDQRLTTDEVAQRGGKTWQSQSGDCASLVCGRTPNDTKYFTPGNEEYQRQHISQQRAWKVSHDEDMFYLDTPPINLEVNGTTLSQLHDLLKEASYEAAAGNFNEANAAFRDAVSGFRFRLSPTHNETLRAAYLYACFYAKSSEIEKADAVLNWMSTHHIQKWGPRHDNAYLHYARMIELFRSWGRQQDADILVYKLLDDETDEGVNILGIGTETAVSNVPMSIDLDRSFPETDDPQLIDRQLKRIDLAVISNIEGLDDVLKVIIRHCESKPRDLEMSLQACRAKCALAKWHSNASSHGEVSVLLKSARKTITPFLSVEEEPLSRKTIETAKALAYQFLEMKDEPSCNAVLEDITSSLEARSQTFESDENDKMLLLDLVLTFAFHLHEVASWDRCRCWVERGFGLAMRMHGIKSPEARRFQKILDKEDFDMRSSISVNDLMSSSGGFFNIRLVSNPGSCR
ncbi:unnamed protein product [Fusarium equiseti]|uniref:Clr5 domain-containing protein n=1 Tax=Fusarium equiseti TaxID=61235 RepID=A0A8J2IRR6_FUSEQ|nr:unnamed protein product [Fusarium equiseti]